MTLSCVCARGPWPAVLVSPDLYAWLYARFRRRTGWTTSPAAPPNSCSPTTSPTTFGVSGGLACCFPHSPHAVCVCRGLGVHGPPQRKAAPLGGRKVSNAYISRLPSAFPRVCDSALLALQCAEGASLHACARAAGWSRQLMTVLK